MKKAGKDKIEHVFATVVLFSFTIFNLNYFLLDPDTMSATVRKLLNWAFSLQDGRERKR